MSIFVYLFTGVLLPGYERKLFINAMRKSLSKNHIELKKILLSAPTLTFINSATLLRNAS